MMHSQLSKEMGLKIEDQPLTFTTAAAKVFTTGNGRVADKGKAGQISYW